jgi:DNA polymerase-4
LASSEKKYIEGRKIIHIDMDAFYASVEQRDNPELKGKPIAVGGGSKRGVTTTASYEARKFGVRSAMPGWKAKELCPHLIFVPPRFQVYKEVSLKIRKIFKKYTDLIEPLSLDEAFLDVTQNKINNPIATDIAASIKKNIFETTQLTASAGVSYCKFLAKIASDVDKPNGITVIKPHRAIEFIEELPVRKFFGVGKVTAQKMEALGIYTGKDLAILPKNELVRLFGKSGNFYYNIVRGIDNRPVVPNRIRKSLAVERTLESNLNDMNAIFEFTNQLAEKLHERLTKAGFSGKTLTLKLKNADFIIKTRSITQSSPFQSIESIKSQAFTLLQENKNLCKNIRLIGLTISNNTNENTSNGQLKLF